MAYLIIAMGLHQNNVTAQYPVFYLNFDNPDVEATLVPKEKAYYAVDLA